MASTVAQSSLSPTFLPSMTPNSSLPTNHPNQDVHEYQMVLLAIYCVVLLLGTISLSLMMHMMKSSSTSITSIAVLNLIFAHFVFLFTVPFRIYYYANNQWNLGHSWCKVVSSMIHIHMYMSFVFYGIILITRLLTFYHKIDRVASLQRILALVISGVLWIVVIVVVPFIIHFYYGKNTEESSDCFHFGESIMSSTLVLNYVVSTFIIVVTFVLTALQTNVLRVLYRKHRQGCTVQQDFAAQLKSLFFALIMVVCFMPYHVFRLNYLEHIELQSVNEVLLSLTTFNCLDMLTFLGGKPCNMCSLG